jgi:hypothetical protein
MSSDVCTVVLQKARRGRGDFIISPDLLHPPELKFETAASRVIKVF